MENCPERCLTSKTVYENERNLSHAKINSDAHADRTVGRVAATPVPERERGAPRLAVDARSSRPSWSTLAAWVWKNRSAVHLSFTDVVMKADIHTFTELRRQIHEDLR